MNGESIFIKSDDYQLQVTATATLKEWKEIKKKLDELGYYTASGRFAEIIKEAVNKAEERVNHYPKEKES